MGALFVRLDCMKASSIASLSLAFLAREDALRRSFRDGDLPLQTACHAETQLSTHACRQVAAAFDEPHSRQVRASGALLRPRFQPLTGCEKTQRTSHSDAHCSLRAHPPSLDHSIEPAHPAAPRTVLSSSRPSAGIRRGRAPDRQGNAPEQGTQRIQPVHHGRLTRDRAYTTP